MKQQHIFTAVLPIEIHYYFFTQTTSFMKVLTLAYCVLIILACTLATCVFIYLAAIFKIGQITFLACAIIFALVDVIVIGHLHSITQSTSSK